MVRVLACVMLMACSAAGEQAVPLGKKVDLGPLAEAFEVVSSEVAYDRVEVSYNVAFKLRAKKDVDTCELSCKVGAFDKARLLLEAKPLSFDDGFPLLKGESTWARCKFTNLPFQEDGLPWHILCIRAVKKPN